MKEKPQTTLQSVYATSNSTQKLNKIMYTGNIKWESVNTSTLSVLMASSLITSAYYYYKPLLYAPLCVPIPSGQRLFH